MTIEKNFQTIRQFLVAFKFENINISGGHEIWKQSKKSLVFRINTKNSCFNDCKKQFLKLVLENFKKNEIKELLRGIKKNKIIFNKRSQTKILKIAPNQRNDTTNELLKILLPKEADKNSICYSTPIEFSEKLTMDVKKKFLRQLDFELAKSMDKKNNV